MTKFDIFSHAIDLGGGNICMNEFKEEYIKKIIETIISIEDIEVLIYLDTFIKEIIKAEE